MNHPQLNRLATVFMESSKIRHSEALAHLESLHLHIACGREVAASRAHQAALLTAVNCAKRAFLGGVSVALSSETPLLVPWPGAHTLNEAVASLGGFPEERTDGAFVLSIGSTEPADRLLTVYCDAWRAGVAARCAQVRFAPASDGVLGGVLAGALGVAKAFFRSGRLEPDDHFEVVGLSLWRPELDWLSDLSAGPDIEHLPKKMWLLGLGHLGQAYGWTLSLLPFRSSDSPNVFLQDFDNVTGENLTAALLCNEKSVGLRKTRVVEQWLERRGFVTSLIERAFGPDSRAHPEEPLVALAGFDSPAPRRALEDHGFRFIVDGGVGSAAANFDELTIHTFPQASRSAREVFPESAGASRPRLDRTLLDDYDDHGACGFVVDGLSKTAASSSFVGACTSALAVAEIIRVLHGGTSYEVIHWKLRGAEPPIVCARSQPSSGNLAAAGYLAAA